MTARLALGARLFSGRRRPRTRRGRLRLVLLVTFGLAVAAALGGLLGARLDAWRQAGPETLEHGLWLLAAGFGLTTAGLGLVVVLEDGFGDRASLVFTLPWSSPARVRALFLAGAARLAHLWLTFAVAFAAAALPRLGAAAAGWLVLVLAAGLAGLLACLVGTIVTLLALRGRPGRLAVVVLGLAVLGVAAWLALRPEVPASPLAAAVVLLAGVGLALGPGAGPLGDAYAAAFHALQGRSPRAARRRWLSRLTGVLLRHRSAGAALAVKEILARGRHWVNWGRVVAASVTVAAYPLLHARLRSLGVGDGVAVVGFVVAGVLAVIIDGASSPLGSEGERLALLLTAPLTLGQLLRAKLAAFVVPFSAVGAATGAGLGLAVGLGAAEAARAGAAAALMVGGLGTLFVLGSAFDVDLDLDVGSGLQALLHEEVPLTPVRLVLSALGVLLAVGELALLARAGWGGAIVAVALLDLAIVTLGWRLAVAAVERKVRREGAG